MKQRIISFCKASGIPLLHYAVLLLFFGLLSGFCEAIEPTALAFAKTLQRGQYEAGVVHVCASLPLAVRQTTRACDL